MSSSANYTFQWNSFSTFLFFNSSKFISIFILINIIKFNFQKIFSAPINCYIAFLTFTEITSVIPSSPYWFCINNITPTDQSIDFPSSHLWLLAVAQQMEFQTLYFYIIKFFINVKQKPPLFRWRLILFGLNYFLLVYTISLPPHSQFVNVCQ